MKYKNIIFDMGNVIIDFSPDYVLAQFTSDLKLINRLKHAIFFDDLWVQADAAKATPEDIYQNAIQILPDVDRQLILEIITDWYKHKTENARMFEIAKELKEHGYHLYLCSNAAKSFYLYEQGIETFRLLDGKLISCDIQVMKPERAYFEQFLNQYKLKAEECFFVDDSIANIKGAFACGIDGYWYNGNTELFYAFLKKVNIL